eukprot:m.364242 g.364242  ORF g.364242 m.364242 type:complete len:219 (+) comp26100_c0_seq1:125-781(+)
MAVRAAKAKGRRLQQLVAQMIRTQFPSISESDVVSLPMGLSGPDVSMSREARTVFPFVIECKNHEKPQLWQAWKQCLSYSTRCEEDPLVVLKKNHAEPVCLLEQTVFEDLVASVGNSKQPNYVMRHCIGERVNIWKEVEELLPVRKQCIPRTSRISKTATASKKQASASAADEPKPPELLLFIRRPTFSPLACIRFEHMLSLVGAHAKVKRKQGGIKK